MLASPEKNTLEQPIQEGVFPMGRTIAEGPIAQGEREAERKGELVGLKRVFVRQLRQRFGDVPPPIEQTIKTTTSLVAIKSWMMRFVDAQALDDIGIPAAGDGGSRHRPRR